MRDLDSVPRVYRFFAEPDHLKQFMQGRWQGMGVHALAFVAPDSSSQLVIQLKQTSLMLDLHIRASEKTGLWRRMRQLLKKNSHTSLQPIQSDLPGQSFSQQSEHRLHLKNNWDALHVHVDVDFARLELGQQYRLEVQAIEADRLHVHLYEILSGSGERLHFSGALRQS